MMFFSIRTTSSPFRRNSAAAETPLKPPPTIRTSHLMSFVERRTVLVPSIIKVVIHQF